MIVTDPDLGFKGFHVLPGIEFADEFLDLEWLFDRYRQFDLFVPILIQDYIDNAPGGAKSLESLIEKGYLEETGINVMATEFLVEVALLFYSRKAAPAAEVLAQNERQHIINLTTKLFEKDPAGRVTYFIVTRMYGNHGTCWGKESLKRKLQAFGHWLDRGYYVIPVSTLNRSKPLEEQLHNIVWEYPETVGVS